MPTTRPIRSVQTLGACRGNSLWTYTLLVGDFNSGLAPWQRGWDRVWKDSSIFLAPNLDLLGVKEQPLAIPPRPPQ